MFVCVCEIVKKRRLKKLISGSLTKVDTKNSGGGVVTAEIKLDDEPIKFDLMKMDETRYELRLIPNRCGIYQVHMYLNLQPIKGSPFVIKIDNNNQQCASQQTSPPQPTPRSATGVGAAPMITSNNNNNNNNNTDYSSNTTTQITNISSLATSTNNLTSLTTMTTTTTSANDNEDKTLSAPIVPSSIPIASRRFSSVSQSRESPHQQTRKKSTDSSSSCTRSARLLRTELFDLTNQSDDLIVGEEVKLNGLLINVYLKVTLLAFCLL